MIGNRFSDDDLARMLRARADRVDPSGIREDIVAAMQRERADRAASSLTRTRPSRGALLFAAALLGGAALAASLTAGSRPTLPEETSVDLGIFAPITGRIVYSDGLGIWGIDPSQRDDPGTRRQLAAKDGIPLGWSRDGTELLIRRRIAPGLSTDSQGLFVLHADGSETQVTERPMAIRGATISPDGSRVVFATDYTLWAADANGGPATMLVGSQEGGTVEDPTFSPDGRQIAYDEGMGDNSHKVWVVDADGTDAHQITPDTLGDCACHVYGLAWSPAGDRIALGLEGTIYTFATDGTDIRRMVNQGNEPKWSPDGSQIAYTISCLEQADGCGLRIADADGSNVREFGSAASGPWHPGTSSRSFEPTGAPPSSRELPVISPSPSVVIRTSEPVAVRNPCGYRDGTWRFGPTSPDPATTTVLGCSRDGTLLLIQKGKENLFILHDDGAVTQVTDKLTGFTRLLGSSRPAGATISPDGSRVVFAGLTNGYEEGRSCHDGALFAVDAAGGRAELMWTSQIAQNGLLNFPAFSPDGTQIAFADGYCDSTHSVWVMNADGSEAHQVLVAEDVGLGAGHVRGLAWSPAGDRLALKFEDSFYTFAPDGSDFRLDNGIEVYCWPGRQC